MSPKVFLDTNALDRPVIDKTGITGRFDFHLEYTPDRFVTADAPGSGPSIFTAVQEQLGLKLEKANGPAEFLVIDSIESSERTDMARRVRAMALDNL